MRLRVCGLVCAIGWVAACAPSRPTRIPAAEQVRDEEPSPSPPQTHSPMRMFFVDNGEEPLLRVFEDGGPWLVWSMVSLSEGEEWTLPGGLRVTEDGRPSQAELATVPDFRAPPSHVWL
ncbi:MAG: hypothetical protein JKY37_01620, partial [Nannocystaceae bacterium]|nr:hypothetical protein [Nannocystaceae bacterium]